MSIRTAARLILGYAALVESGAAMIRFRERTVAFMSAMERAVALGRRLVVIGDPDAGMHTRVADITKGPIPELAADSSVVFVSCVLEYVPDLEAALTEIARIAGSADNVFIVNVQPWTLTARLYPNARWRGTTSVGSKVDMHPVGLDEKLMATGVVGALAAAAFWPRGKGKR